MDFYSLLRPLLFKFEPETAHHLAMRLLALMPNKRRAAERQSPPVELMGLSFANPIGLAAGLDKNGDYIDLLAKLGFGFIEIGSVTPKPQTGNPKPRLFRLVEDKAIINRMGFNNKGVDYLVNNVKRAEFSGVLGINIGKNLTTPVERALEDYQYCLDKVYEMASYVTINVSSPNTPGLRDLQYGELLSQLFQSLKKQQLRLSETHKRYVPMVAKLAPDADDESLKASVAALNDIGIDGFIFSNTTNSRPKGLKSAYAAEQGGLSGAPLAPLSLKGLQLMRQHTDLPIINVGGIDSPEAAKQRFEAGAQLLQIYSALIYQGPSLPSTLL